MCIRYLLSKVFRKRPSSFQHTRTLKNNVIINARVVLFNDMPQCIPKKSDQIVWPNIRA